MSKKRVEQQVLDLRHAPQFSRDDFVVSDTNRAALQFIEQWPDWSQRSVLLGGSQGSGKSHLASIWCQLSGGICIAAQDLQIDGLHDLLAYKYIVIDDADHPSLNEQALLHALNMVNEQEGNLLLTARTCDIGQWPGSLDDLRSRLRILPIVCIGMLQDPLLEAVLHKLFADKQLPVTSSTILYLMTRMERSFSEAVRIVDLLDQLSLSGHRAVSRRLASEVFK